jgi:hypothetical protein
MTIESKTEDQLVNDLRNCETPIRSSDPIQAWEAHPVVSQYLHLKDRQIARAIDTAFDIKY